MLVLFSDCIVLLFAFLLGAQLSKHWVVNSGFPEHHSPALLSKLVLQRVLGSDGENCWAILLQPAAGL